MLARAAASAAALQSAAKSSGTIVGEWTTSAIWKAMPRPWLMTLAPILISFSFRLDSDQSLIGSGVRQRPQEIAEIVCQRMKLEPHGVGGERPARQPRLLDRALALFDPLLACAALVVEGDDRLGRARQVGDLEADARIKLVRVPLDFGDHPARLGPASRLIAEIGMEPAHLVRRSPNRTLEQVADPVLQTRLAGSRIAYLMFSISRNS